MRHTPHYLLEDRDEVRRLVRENPWATIVSHVPDQGIVASHYPFLLDEEASTGDEIVLLSHVGRPDEQLHRLGDSEVLVIVQGPHGYVSPSWYAPGASQAPTWNFSVAHCYGVPEVLDEEANLHTLARIVEHFERHVEQPMLLDLQWGAPVAKGTVGLRLPITRFQCKVKLSEDKDPETQRRVIEALRRPGPYRNLPLADDMVRARAERR